MVLVSLKIVPHSVEGFKRYDELFAEVIFKSSKKGVSLR